jgi:hypothetical protein
MTSEPTEPHAQAHEESASGALSAPDPAAALRNAATLWAEANTRPETLDRRDKLKDKISAVTSFSSFHAGTRATRRRRTFRAGAATWKRRV